MMGKLEPVKALYLMVKTMVFRLRFSQQNQPNDIVEESRVFEKPLLSGQVEEYLIYLAEDTMGLQRLENVFASADACGAHPQIG